MPTTPAPLALRLTAVEAPVQPTVTPELESLHAHCELLVPLWTEIGNLMPHRPRFRAVEPLWRRVTPYTLGSRAVRTVPVARREEGRAMTLAKPELLRWFSDAPAFEEDQLHRASRGL